MRGRIVRSASLTGLVALLVGTAALAEVIQKGSVRVTVDAQMAPRSLPRDGAAPIAVSVEGKIATNDGSTPPQLRALRIDFNRHGRIDAGSLPVCNLAQIQPASSARALSACRGSLVGGGRFWANIVLSGQQPYPTKGRLLVFNGKRGGRPMLLGHIYAPRPFATSFVIPFVVQQASSGAYGTSLIASLPKALGDWGYVTAIDLKLSRRYRSSGKARSYIAAGCPAPRGFTTTPFPLARVSFFFAGQPPLTSVLTRSCSVR